MRKAIKFSGLMLGALAWTACGHAREKDSPNVVLIVMDTLRADYLSFYGDEGETMPYLASLAEEGMLFEHAISTSSWTAPSTASLLTGVYADRHGVHQGFLANLSKMKAGDSSLKLNRISRTTPTLAELFQERGYATFGLASNINIGPEIGFGRGFERFERHDEWPAEALHKLLMGWKDELHAGRPFFLYLHLNDVHKPYQRREAWFKPTPELPEIGLYRSEMGYLDSWIERMLTDIDSGPNTLIAIVSDHGEELNDRGAIGHHMSLHAEVNDIVMLFHGPTLGIRAGRNAREVSGIDLAPTLMELTGFSLGYDRSGQSQDGRSLAAFMLQGIDSSIVARRSGELQGRALVAHRKGSQGGDLFSVVKGRWKLIRKRGKDYLYDLERDPSERTNLRKKQPAKHAELIQELERFKARDFVLETDVSEIEFDTDLLDKLNALGYTEH